MTRLLFVLLLAACGSGGQDYTPADEMIEAEAWVRRHPAWSLHRWAPLPDSNVVLVSVLPAGMRVS